MSAKTTTGLDEYNNFDNANELNNNNNNGNKDDSDTMNAYRSNSAYDTIQAKIKAASEASKKVRKEDEEDPANVSPFDRDGRETATTQANTQF